MRPPRRLGIGQLAACVSLIGAASMAAGAQITSHSTLAFIYLSGEIDARTPERLEEVLNDVQPRVDAETSMAEGGASSLKGQLAGLLGAHLFLDSEGGDVIAAIRAGEILRSHRVSIVVPKDGACASACVLLLCGGVERMIVGRVGIHRPFSAAYSESFSESDQRYRSISASVGKYLHSMNMPTHLIDAMNAVPPDQIRWLSGDELTEFGVGENDPVWKDRYDSVQARAIGISKQEYYSRMHRGREQCSGMQGQAWAKCYYDIVGSPN